ncbi:MAG: hypothetical protein WC776_05040 [Patescibacteria group bacterium]
MMQDAIDANKAEYNQLQEFSKGLGDDPLAMMMNQQRQHIATQMQSAIRDIQQQADLDLTGQAAANKDLEGKARAAVNAAGQVGSMIGEGYIASQIQNNLNALQSIKVAASKAVNDARTAFEQRDDELAFKMVALADDRKKQAQDLIDKNVDLAMKMESVKQNRLAFGVEMQSKYQQMQREGRADAKEQMGEFAKVGAAWSAIPTGARQSAAVLYGSETAAQAVYEGSIKDQQAKTTENFNKNTVEFYKAASLIKDPNAVLNRPNLDGTFSSIKRSEVQVTPDYVQHEVTEGGKKFMAFIDPNDPTAAPLKIPLGDASPQLHYFQDDFGNQMAYDENTGSTKMVADFAGNPSGPGAVYSTQKYLNDSGAPYSQSGVAPPWTASYPDGAIHERNGKPATECGEFINDETGTKFGNSLQDKMKLVDKSIGMTEGKKPPQIGDVIVTNETAKWGHVAAISNVVDLGNGKYEYQLTESNYKKNKDGLGMVTSTRTIASDSPAIQGYVRPKTNMFEKDMESEAPLPKDNSMAWHVKVPDAVVKTGVQNGKVEKVDVVGKFKDGSDMMSVKFRDMDTGAIHIVNGLKSTDIREGSVWGASDINPPIGKSGPEGHTLELRNDNGTPMAPKGREAIPLAQRVIDGESWGSVGSIPSGKFFQTKYNDTIKALAGGQKSLDTALNDWRKDGHLGEVMPEAYINAFQDAAEQGVQKNETKQLQNENLRDTIKTKKIRGARSVVPASEVSSDPRVKFYRQAQAIMPKIRSAERMYEANGGAGNAATDLDLVDSYVKMTGSQVTEAQLHGITENQAKADQIRALPNKWTVGGFLTPESRRQLIELAHKTEEEQKETFDQAMDEYQSRIDANGYDFQLRGKGISNLNSFIGSSVTAEGVEIPVEPQNFDALSSITDPELGQVTFID